MFDELILLAKGGLTVYHGPVKKVEEYFSTLGITVPERVNPPDYFIDILEGIVKPTTTTGITYKQLPVRWMLHNGYPVPMDMLQSIEGMPASKAGENSSHGGTGAPDSGDFVSFAGEFWQDVKHTVEVKRDNIQLNFLKSSDLSNRTTPGVAQQYKYFLGRYVPIAFFQTRLYQDKICNRNPNCQNIISLFSWVMLDHCKTERLG